MYIVLDFWCGHINKVCLSSITWSGPKLILKTAWLLSLMAVPLGTRYIFQAGYYFR